MKELRLLYVEDDEKNREDLIHVLNGEEIEGYTLNVKGYETFEGSIEKIVDENYHIIILDIYRGNPNDNGEKEGLNVLMQIQEQLFIPVIFYSGNTKNVQGLKSQVVGVVTKGDDGIDGLKEEMKRLVKSNLPFLKENVYGHLETEFKSYFWEIIHEQRDIFKPELNDYSLGYLMLRKFGMSLSKQKISSIIGNTDINVEKVLPMEFYLYPTDSSSEYECGEIIRKDGFIYAILTPSCDLIDRPGRKRKANKVIIAKCYLFTEDEGYKKYVTNKKKYLSNLERIIGSRKSDRYFFLPETPFLDNCIIDFQMIEAVRYGHLNEYERVAKLDSPFSESMVSSFIRYYNRIGFPDIDSDYIIRALESNLE